MWQIIFIVGISYAGVCVEANEENALMLCNPQKCVDVGPQIQPGNVDDMLPDEEKLNEMCPSILAMAECSKDTVEACLGASLLESQNSENITIAAVSTLYIGLSDMFTELCDKDSDLHKGYAANSVCMKTVLTNPLSVSLCLLEANTLYGAYRFTSEAKVPETEEICMVAAHAVACASADVMDECGEEARSTWVELVKRSRLMKVICSLEEDLASLKTKYLEFLELEGSRKSVFEKAFDFRKRK